MNLGSALGTFKICLDLLLIRSYLFNILSGNHSSCSLYKKYPKLPRTYFDGVKFRRQIFAKCFLIYLTNFFQFKFIGNVFSIETCGWAH